MHVQVRGSHQQSLTLGIRDVGRNRFLSPARLGVRLLAREEDHPGGRRGLLRVQPSATPHHDRNGPAMNQPEKPQDPSPFRIFAALMGAFANPTVLRCRNASYITTAPATDTLRDETMPAIGIRSR